MKQESSLLELFIIPQSLSSNPTIYVTKIHALPPLHPPTGSNMLDNDLGWLGPLHQCLSSVLVSFGGIFLFQMSQVTCGTRCHKILRPEA